MAIITKDQDIAPASKAVLYIKYVKGSEDAIDVTFDVYCPILDLDPLDPGSGWFPVAVSGTPFTVHLDASTKFRVTSDVTLPLGPAFCTQAETKIRYTVVYGGDDSTPGSVDLLLVPDSTYVVA